MSGGILCFYSDVDKNSVLLRHGATSGGGAHYQENQLCQYNLWYMSLCVGDRFVCRSESSFPVTD